MSAKKIQELLKKIDSTQNDEEVIKYLYEIREVGNAGVVPHLINLMVKTPNEDIRNAIVEILFDIKDQEAVEPILKGVLDEKNALYRSLLVSVFWQSSLQVDSILTALVDIALKYDYLTCFEVVTVIENKISHARDKDVIECLHKINEHVTYIKDDKTTVLLELKAVLENLLLEQ